jgi:hypothetical protein
VLKEGEPPVEGQTSLACERPASNNRDAGLLVRVDYNGCE